MLYSFIQFSPATTIQKEAVESSNKKTSTYFGIRYDKSGKELIPVIELDSFVNHSDNRIQINLFPKEGYRQSFLVARYEKRSGVGSLYITNMDAAVLEQGHGRALFETLLELTEVLNHVLSKRDYGQPYPKIESIQGEISPDTSKINKPDLIKFYKEMGCTITGPVNSEQLYYQM